MERVGRKRRGKREEGRGGERRGEERRGKERRGEEGNNGQRQGEQDAGLTMSSDSLCRDLNLVMIWTPTDFSSQPSRKFDKARTAS